MAKLRLDLDALLVESFDTVAQATGRGTVAGNQFEVGRDPDVIKQSQSNCPDCYYTIISTCMSCGDPVCTMASKTECPSCYNSCGDCGPTCACPAEQAEPVTVQPRGI